MFSPTHARPSELRRLLPLTLVLALAVIGIIVAVSMRIAAQSAPTSVAAIVADPPTDSVASAIPASAATTPRELVEMEAAGLVTLARPNGATTPRELVEMEAAGLVTLARPNGATTPRELVATEATGLVTPARPNGAAMPRELVEMEAAGLVTLARPLPAAPPRLAWQGGTGYHVWGDCTDPFVRQAAPELCM